MLGRVRLWAAIGRGVGLLPDRAAHGLVVRELNTWIRLEFLGVIARTGVADALHEPRSLGEIAEKTRISDVDLLGALLDLGVALREVRERRGRYSIRGRRLRAIADRSPDLRGMVEELIVYDNPIYTALESHLRGARPRPYDADHGAVIAAASRLAEPLLGPTLRTLAAELRPGTVLDIGCGSGIYLRHILDTARDASGVGIDLDAEAVAQAEDNLVELRLEGRCRVEQGNIEARARALGEFDLVLLLNNVYYWAPTERVEILKTLRQCVAPAGTLVVATALPDGQAFNRHLDMILRVTQNSHRLPTRDELRDDLRHAGFEHITLTEPIPRSGLAVAIAR